MSYYLVFYLLSRIAVWIGTRAKPLSKGEWVILALPLFPDFIALAFLTERFYAAAIDHATRR